MLKTAHWDYSLVVFKVGFGLFVFKVLGSKVRGCVIHL
jgi:hypothetical protein